MTPSSTRQEETFYTDDADMAGNIVAGKLRDGFHKVEILDRDHRVESIGKADAPRFRVIVTKEEKAEQA